MNVIVCRGPRMKETHRESLGVRWCFACRQRVEFVYVVHGPVEPGYYEPLPSVQCTSCNTPDADLFPGRTREWE